MSRLILRVRAAAVVITTTVWICTPVAAFSDSPSCREQSPHIAADPRSPDSSTIRIVQSVRGSNPSTERLISRTADSRSLDVSDFTWDVQIESPSADTQRIATPTYARGDQTMLRLAPSAPVIATPPGFGFFRTPDSAAYFAFAASQQRRKEVIYLGGVNGLLHGFDADTGERVMTYALRAPAPDATLERESRGAYPLGTPSIANAVLNGSWRTVLVGGMNGAGRAIYALDVTDPSRLSTMQSARGGHALWEFTANDDPDLGLTYGQPIVAKLADGTWAAIFGNGYGSEATALYIVSVSNGALIRKITAEDAKTSSAARNGTRGLSSSAVVDIDGDSIADYVYAGDLSGSLWKFDITSQRSSQWKVAFEGKPLFRARSADGEPQPIFLRPEVIRGRRGLGVLVLVGAGASTEIAADPADSPGTFYGLWDHQSYPIAGRSSLQTRRILADVSVANAPHLSEVRLIADDLPAAETSGWYLDLASSATQEHERFATHPTVRDAKVIFVTHQIKRETCLGLRRTIVLETNPDAGTTTSLFDLNRDGLFNAADTTFLRGAIYGSARVGGVATLASSHFGLANPSVTETTTRAGVCAQLVYAAGAGTRVVPIAVRCRGDRGRQSWRQLP